MGIHLIDRLTGTFVFRALLLVSAVFVLPTLALGLMTTPFVLAMNLTPGNALGAVAFAAVALGGAVGMTGWVLALRASRRPARHNLTATLVCLLVGVVSALAVTGYVIFITLEGLGTPWGNGWWAVGPAAFAAGTAIWALDGLGRMQRLARLYRERTGRALDGIPVALLLVALGLAVAVVFVSATL